MGDGYLWIKAVHIVAVIAWMAGLLYMPRLFVYHTQVKPDSESSALFKVMERKLMHAITVPAATVAWIFGFILLHLSGYANTGWFMVKIFFVVCITIFTFVVELWRKDFLNDRNTRSTKFYRMANEIPTLLLIIIVVMVVVKPF